MNLLKPRSHKPIEPMYDQTTVQSRLIFTALLCAAADLHLSDSEAERIAKDEFWSGYFYDGCTDDFLTHLKEETILGVCREEIEKIKGNEVKREFINALIRVVLADGNVEDSEVSILHTFANFAGITDDEMLSFIKEYRDSKQIKPTSILTSNNLIFAGILMIASDGEINDNEGEALFSDPYWSQFAYEGCVEEFVALLEEDKISDIITEHIIHFVITEEDKESFIHALLRLIMSDGEVNQNEVQLLQNLVSPIGVTHEGLMKSIGAFKRTQSASTKSSGCLGLVALIAVMTLGLTLIVAV
jgi:uncharacterized tellurite resistance protein B-like protein